MSPKDRAALLLIRCAIDRLMMSDAKPASDIIGEDSPFESLYCVQFGSDSSPDETTIVEVKVLWDDETPGAQNYSIVFTVI